MVNTLTETITVRGTDYPFLSGEQAIDPATKIIWSLLKIASTEAYESALETRDPVGAWQKVSAETRSSDRDSAFLFALNLDLEIEPNPAKNPRVALENNLRKLIPELPTGLGATELIEFINAVLPQEKGLPKEEEPSQESEGLGAPPEKKTRRKKGFGEKVEVATVDPELPTLEAIAGREVSPEELANVKFEGKTIDDVAETSMIGISDEALAQLRPDLMTIEGQELQAALREQEAYRLNIVSIPVPPDSDELEDLL